MLLLIKLISIEVIRTEIIFLGFNELDIFSLEEK